MKANYYKLEDKKIRKRETIKFLISRFKKFWGYILISLIAILIATFSEALIPIIIKRITDNAVSTGDMSMLIRYVRIAFGLLGVGIIFKALQTRLIGTMGQKVLFDLRQDLFKKIQELPMKFFVYNQSGDIITRITQDVENINQMLSGGLVRSLSIIFKVLIIIVVMTTINFKLTLVSLAPLVFILAALFLQGSILQNLIKKSLDINSKVTNLIQDTLNSFALIKSFNKGEYMTDKMITQNKEYLNTTKKIAFFTSLARSLIGALVKIGITFVIFISFKFLENNVITLGSLISFSIYIIQLFSPLSRLSMLSNVIRKGLASTQRIAAIFSLENDLVLPEKPFIPKNNEIRGEIEFKKVTFGYEEGQSVLDNIDFHINPKESVAIVGPTGGGKTTFVNLIARLYDTDSGSVIIDDVDVKKWDLQFLRSKIGYLLQDTFLFEDTIFNNLRYGKNDLKKKEAQDLLKNLGFWDLVNKNKISLDTKLKKNSKNLSTGQRQILAIARILLREPKILILDEATASIDTKSEIAVQKAIDYASKEITTIIIAHRINTVENADRIIVIKNNKIRESGTQQELIEQKGEFYEMWKEFKGKS